MIYAMIQHHLQNDDVQIGDFCSSSGELEIRPPSPLATAIFATHNETRGVED